MPGTDGRQLRTDVTRLSEVVVTGVAAQTPRTQLPFTVERLDLRAALAQTPGVVEVAPAYDHADITAIAGATVAMYMLGLRAERLSAGS